MKFAYAWLCLPMLAALPGLAAAQTAATLGNTRISADEVKQIVSSNRELGERFAASADAVEPVLREEIVRRALIEEARAKGWDRQDAVARQIAQAANSVILSTYLASLSTPPSDYPPEKEVLALFEASKGKINAPARYRLSQIFVGRPANAGDVSTAKLRAEQLSKQVRLPGSDFSALARSFSDDAQSRARGGDVDWLEEAALAPEILAVLRTMKPGQISDAIETQNGWHILRLQEFQAAAPATLEQARPTLVNALRTQRANEMSRAYVDDLLKKTPLRIDQPTLEALRAQMKK